MFPGCFSWEFSLEMGFACVRGMQVGVFLIYVRGLVLLQGFLVLGLMLCIVE